MSQQQNHKKIVVFYHDPCLDGAAAAWVAYEKWGETAEYVGIKHDEEGKTKKFILDHLNKDTIDTKDALVVFADYTPPRDIMDDIARIVKKVSVYDHHDSAIEEMKGYQNPKVHMTFDKSHSGAAIVWGALGNTTEQPQAIELVQMIDLEQTNQLHFFQIAAFFDRLPTNNINNILTSFNKINAMPLAEIIERGEDIHLAQLRAIQPTSETTAQTYVSILPDTAPVRIPLINGSQRALGRTFSTYLRKLAEKNPAGIALSWYEDGDGVVHVSVRTNGVPDAGKVAEYIGSRKLGHGLGGGGHKDSAVARFTVDQFNKQFVRETQGEKNLEFEETIMPTHLTRQEVLAQISHAQRVGKSSEKTIRHKR